MRTVSVTSDAYGLPHTMPGNTPLIRINSLSDALGVEILGKAEVGTSEECSRDPCMLTCGHSS